MPWQAKDRAGVDRQPPYRKQPDRRVEGSHHARRGVSLPCPASPEAGMDSHLEIGVVDQAQYHGGKAQRRVRLEVREGLRQIVPSATGEAPPPRDTRLVRFLGAAQ